VCRAVLAGFWLSACGAVALLAYGCASGSFAAFVLGAALACTSLATGTLAGLKAAPTQSGCLKILTGATNRAHPGDPDLLLDLPAVEVAGVFALGRDILACLSRTCPCGGDGGAEGFHGPNERDRFFLSWRCASRCAAARLARQLGEWQTVRAPLRLLAAKGRCAVLMEDEHCWLTLPELSVASG
jgi:hypothetical protein